MSLPGAKSDRTNLLRALVPLLIALVTAAVFLPALHNDFVTWDDDTTLTANLDYRGFGGRELRWMFTTFFLGHYQPLSWMSYSLDYLIWGTNPVGYHLTNLLLHAVNAALFYLLALRLLALAKASDDEGSLRAGACFAALFFALHPLRVESVAWATERRDVLSGLFFLLTLLAYVKAATSERSAECRRWVGLAFVAYVLSLLAKATGMTLPVVLVVLDVFPLKRLNPIAGAWRGAPARTIWLEKLPFLAAAIATAVAAFMAQSASGAMDTMRTHSLLHRIAQASFGFWYYLVKTVFPFRVYPMYDLPMQFSPWEPVYVASFVCAAAVTAVLFLKRRRWPAALASWIYYAALIAPVSGIAQSGSQMVADRYSYLSCLSWALLAGGGFACLWRRRPHFDPIIRHGVPFAAAALLLSLAFLTERQIARWRDSESLYRYVVAYTPRPSKIAFNNLASLLAERGQFDEAIGYFRRAVEIDPKYDEARSNLGNALNAQGKTAEAMAQYREALRSNPNSLVAHHYLAIALAREGKIDEAVEHYRKAVAIDDGFLEGHNNLGMLLAARGQYPEAIEQYRRALEIAPGFAIAQVNMGEALLVLGRPREAIEHFRKALEIEPNSTSARSGLAKALAQEQRAAPAAQP